MHIAQSTHVIIMQLYSYININIYIQNISILFAMLIHKQATAFDYSTCNLDITTIYQRSLHYFHLCTGTIAGF